MTSENNSIYLEFLGRIIEAQKDLYGELAVKTAYKVKELEISKDGKVVQIFGPPIDAARNLFSEFEALGGRISKNLCEFVLVVYRKQYPDMILPEC